MPRPCAEAAALASRAAIQRTQEQNAELSARSKGEMEELEVWRRRSTSVQALDPGLKSKAPRFQNLIVKRT